MAIEKMHFINIVGPIKKLDEFVMDGILPFHVELVQAMSVLDGDKKESILLSNRIPMRD